MLGIELEEDLFARSQRMHADRPARLWIIAVRRHHVYDVQTGLLTSVDAKSKKQATQQRT